MTDKRRRGRPHGTKKYKDDNGKKVGVYEHRKLESQKKQEALDYLRDKDMVAIKIDDYKELRKTLAAYYKEDEEVTQEVDEQIAQQVKEQYERFICPHCKGVVLIQRQVEGGGY